MGPPSPAPLRLRGSLATAAPPSLSATGPLQSPIALTAHGTVADSQDWGMVADGMYAESQAQSLFPFCYAQRPARAPKGSGHPRTACLPALEPPAPSSATVGAGSSSSSSAYIQEQHHEESVS